MELGGIAINSSKNLSAHADNPNFFMKMIPGHVVSLRACQEALGRYEIYKIQY